jgi:hypothetical protein
MLEYIPSAMIPAGFSVTIRLKLFNCQESTAHEKHKLYVRNVLIGVFVPVGFFLCLLCLSWCSVCAEKEREEARRAEYLRFLENSRRLEVERVERDAAERDRLHIVHHNPTIAINIPRDWQAANNDFPYSAMPYSRVDMPQDNIDPITCDTIKNPIKMKCCQKIIDLQTFQQTVDKSRCMFCRRLI